MAFPTVVLLTLQESINKVNKLSVRLPQNLKFVPENSL